MGLRKGQTNNINGRPAGKENKFTTEMKVIVGRIIKRNFTQKKIQEDLNLLTPDKRLEVLTRLLQFTLPRPTELKLSNNEGEDTSWSDITVEIIDSRLQVDHSLLN